MFSALAALEAAILALSAVVLALVSASNFIVLACFMASSAATRVVVATVLAVSAFLMLIEVYFSTLAASVFVIFLGAQVQESSSSLSLLALIGFAALEESAKAATGAGVCPGTEGAGAAVAKLDPGAGESEGPEG